MIPPLIPLPTSQAQAPVQDDRAAKEDLFSTLFSPSTPRASPTLGAAQLQDVRLLKHGRTVSTDSEFGAFVSVPSNEDPLASAGDAGPSSVNDSESRSPLKGTQFLEEVKAANERNKGILDELLYHEDDPLYFLNSQGQGQPSHVPQHSTSHSNAAPKGVSLLDLDPDEPIPEPPPPLDPLLHPHSIETALHEASNTIHDAYAPMHTSRHPSRQQNLTEPSDFGAFASASTTVIPQYPSTSPSSHHDHVRSPSLPPSPSRPSMPELQRTQTQSIFTPSISSTTSRWMSSFLSKPTTNLTFRPSLSRTPTHEDRLSASSWSSRSHSESITPPLSDVPNRAQTLPSASSEITHGTPFASQPYVAPSGAPGFAGDRTWNTSKFEFDKENVERKSVRLVGRKEMTTAVLTVDLADRVSCLPFVYWRRQKPDSPDCLAPAIFSRFGAATTSMVSSLQPGSTWNLPQHPLHSM